MSNILEGSATLLNPNSDISKKKKKKLTAAERRDLEKLEKEEGIKITKLETWHDSKNAELLKKYDDGKCGGVPFFYDEKTKKFICGSVDYEEFKKWAKG